VLLVVRATADAQDAGKVYRIGFLHAGSPSGVVSRLKAFRDELTRLGYVEGKNVILETRYGEGQAARMPALATELVNLKPDVVVTTGPTDTSAAKKATSTLPMMAQDSDPVGSDLSQLGSPRRKHHRVIDPLSRDRRQITGTSQADCA